MSDRKLMEDLAEVAPNVCEFVDFKEPVTCRFRRGVDDRDDYFLFDSNGRFHCREDRAIVACELLDRLEKDPSANWTLSSAGRSWEFI